jgi:hypothetical protein
VDRRYQVFVSSPYEDLQEERRAVMDALLRLDCIPTGMELFPAADDDSWTLIKGFIQRCDYYVVILAGRYGSLGLDGKSYTEMEYDFAVEAGVPAIAFLHENIGAIPSDRTEQGDVGRRALAAFREKIQRARHANFWTSSGELPGKVVFGMLSLMRTKRRPGWVRADVVPEKIKDEMLRLRQEIDSLAKELAVAKRPEVPEGLEDLAQGTDTVKLQLLIHDETESRACPVEVRWDDLIRVVLPVTVGNGATEEAVWSAVSDFLKRVELSEDFVEPYGIVSMNVSPNDVRVVLNQMLALGLIEAQANLDTRETRWFATPYGARTGSRMVAIKRLASA